MPVMSQVVTMWRTKFNWATVRQQKFRFDIVFVELQLVAFVPGVAKQQWKLPPVLGTLSNMAGTHGRGGAMQARFKDYFHVCPPANQSTVQNRMWIGRNELPIPRKNKEKAITSQQLFDKIPIRGG